MFGRPICRVVGKAIERPQAACEPLDRPSNQIKSLEGNSTMRDLTTARRERRVLGARRYPKNCRRLCKKIDTPMVFRTEGTYTRECNYTIEGGSRALSRSFAPGTQPRRPSSIYQPRLGSTRWCGAWELYWCGHQVLH